MSVAHAFKNVSDARPTPPPESNARIPWDSVATPVVAQGFDRILSPKVVKKFRSDFLTLVGNIKRLKTYQDAIKWADAVIRWREALDQYIERAIRELKRFRTTEIQVNLAELWEHDLQRAVGKIRHELYSLPIGRYELATRYTYLPHDRAEVEQQLFRDFQKEAPGWDRRVRRKAQEAWRDLDTVLKSMQDSLSSRDLELVVPQDETLRVNGFHVTLRGFGKRNIYSAQEVVEKLRAGLRLYEQRAKAVYPWLLRYRLPLVINANCGLDRGGSYSPSEKAIELCPAAFASKSESPRRLVHIIAHEMGHHIYRVVLSAKDQEFWRLAVKGADGPFDLREVAKKSKEHFWVLDEDLARRDPVFALRGRGVMDDPRHQHDNLETQDGIAEYLAAGNDPVITLTTEPITGYAAKNPEEALCEALGMLVAYGPRAVLPVVRQRLGMLLPQLRVTARIQRGTTAAAPEVADRTTVNLKREYDALNRKLWGGELPDVPLKWVQSRTKGGWVKARGVRNDPSSWVLKELAISDLLESTYDQFLGILVHEMIHVYVTSNGIIEAEHGRAFMNERARVSKLVDFEIPTSEDVTKRHVSKNVGAKPLGVVLFVDKGAIQVYRDASMPTVINTMNGLPAGWRKGRHVEFYRVSDRELLKYPIQRTFPKGKVGYYPVDQDLIDRIRTGQHLGTMSTEGADEPKPKGNWRDEVERRRRQKGLGGATAAPEMPFNVGDEVLFGKYKNKRGRIVKFGKNPKGQVTVLIDPIPKGRKKTKEMGLFKIWTTPDAIEAVVTAVVTAEADALIRGVDRLRKLLPPIDAAADKVEALFDQWGRTGELPDRALKMALTKHKKAVTALSAVQAPADLRPGEREFWDEKIKTIEFFATERVVSETEALKKELQKLTPDRARQIWRSKITGVSGDVRTLIIPDLIKGAGNFLERKAKFGPFTLVDDHGISEYRTRYWFEALTRVQKLLQQKGFGYLLYGTLKLKPITGPWTGMYYSAGDYVQLDTGTDARPNLNGLVYVLIHELGHRLWFRFMDGGARDKFSSPWIIQEEQLPQVLDRVRDLLRFPPGEIAEGHKVLVGSDFSIAKFNGWLDKKPARRTRWLKLLARVYSLSISETISFSNGTELDKKAFTESRKQIKRWRERVTSQDAQIYGPGLETEEQRVRAAQQRAQKKLDSEVNSLLDTFNQHSEVGRSISLHDIREFFEPRSSNVQSPYGDVIRDALQLERIKPSVTDYGQTNRHEDFAELFAQVITGRVKDRQQALRLQAVIPKGRVVAAVPEIADRKTVNLQTEYDRFNQKLWQGRLPRVPVKWVRSNKGQVVSGGARLTPETIVQECADIDDGWQLGLRVVPRHVKVGQILKPSYHWIDGSQTRKKLPGTSAIQLRSGGQLDAPVTNKSASRALQQVSPYVGVGVALLAGDAAGSGEDPYEVLIRNAEVMAYWRGPSTAANIPFKVGDTVLFGKYKNKRGRILRFARNPKGQMTVEIEPIPKGRKQNKELGLFKIWTTPDAIAHAPIGEPPLT